MKQPMLKKHPAKPEFAYDNDLVLVHADERGGNPVAFAVISPIPKRHLIPGDDSTPAGRADWIGAEGEKRRNGQPVKIVNIDAVLWRGIWYVQYVEA